ncbi:seminal metalloprotease 1 isoform X1 [Spodoptera frugiperda]|uniref:Metalloendopeptidase n=1 Tax=Spodoptera frugiperda TaxID=7108 RepID=A0A9R0CVT8_SPOFR|nr:seminal metalloprotease 1 isoform X1 [Spodoptera frugiperda]
MQQFHVRLVVLSIIIVTSISAGSPIYDNVDFETDDAPIYDYVDFETDDTAGEYGDYFDGDTAMPNSQPQAIDGSFARNGLIDENRRWPNHTVVYHINEEDFDEEQLSKIKAAMADIANHSCIIFRPRETDDEHAVIIKGGDKICSSAVGYVAGEKEAQTILLNDSCFRHGSLIHEMLHTLGFRHMQSTYDRDDYIAVQWDNIIPEYKKNFIKYSNKTLTNFGVPYDYNSVLHYWESAFTANGNNTIIPLKENVTIGQRKGLSHGDILKVNRMYCVNNGTGDEDNTFAGYDEEVSIDK